MGIEERYKYQVCENLEYYFATSKKLNYRDPDDLYKKYDEELDCYFKSDGLCGYKKIEKLTSNIKEQKKLYGLIRNDMYDCLIWPVHVNSINQLRGLILQDRIDLTLLDIKMFYTIINRNKSEDDKTKEIQNECKLGKAFVVDKTYIWLKSFKSFDTFIKSRKLKEFVEGTSNFYVKDWSEMDLPPEMFCGVTDKYFAQLFYRADNYKKNTLDEN